MPNNTMVQEKDREKHYKENTPLNTVSKLKKILNSLSIELDEHWLPVSSIGTYSLRLTVKGTDLGTNGKGVSKDYAMASAYAEFLERFQNSLLTLCNVVLNKNAGFRYYVDEKYMNSINIAGLSNSFMNMYFSNRNLQGANIFQKASAFRSVQKIESLLYGEEDNYVTMPFYSLREQKVEYLPYNAYFSHYGSNGMCAGNTYEEAIVQGLSEILERYIQKRILQEKPSLPDIPVSYLQQFPYLYEMYEKLQNQKDFQFLFKDCSFGGKYPVAALVAIHKNTGKYGVKLGCHPYYPLAIERTLTEANQGIDITSYAHHSTLDFTNQNVDDDLNIYNSAKFGIAQYPIEILCSNNEDAFIPVEDVSNMSNKEILDYYVQFILGEGYDILIRNVSYTGFPSFHIIIPTMSEIQNATDTKFRGFNSKLKLAELLSQPHLITKDNCELVIKTLDFFSSSHIDNAMKSHYGVAVKIMTPGEEVGLGWLYMTAMCHIMQGDYRAAANRIGSLCISADFSNHPNPEFYFCMKTYCEGMCRFGHHQKTMEYIKLFFDEETYKHIDDIVKDPMQVMIKQYPAHNVENKDKCLEENCCDYHQYVELLEKFKPVQKENPIDQSDLHHLFSDFICNIKYKI